MDYFYLLYLKLTGLFWRLRGSFAELRTRSLRRRYLRMHRVYAADLKELRSKVIDHADNCSCPACAQFLRMGRMYLDQEAEIGRWEP